LLWHRRTKQKTQFKHYIIPCARDSVMKPPHQHVSLLQRMRRSQPAAATSFRRCFTSTVLSLASEGSDEIIESLIEELTGSGQKRVGIECALGCKAMKLAQVSDGCGGSTEEHVFNIVSMKEEIIFVDSHWYQTTSKQQQPGPRAPQRTPQMSADAGRGCSTTGVCRTRHGRARRASRRFI
jgi:hypothetical protein